MRHWKWAAGVLGVLGVVAFVVAMAIAQPPPPGGAPAEGWGQTRRMGQQAAPTPEEAAQQRLTMLVEVMGGQLGITDADKQALSVCLKEQEEIRQELRQKLQALGQALRQQGAEADIAQQLVEYRMGMQAAQAREVTAEQTLAAALNLAQRPKLEAVALIFGIIDNGVPSGRAAMGMAGRRDGGPGGRQGRRGLPGGRGPGAANPRPAQPPQGR